MDAPTTPDTTTYTLVHRALRTTARRYAVASASLSPDDHVRRAAIVRWGRGFLEELHCHHTIEDAAMFPALIAKVPAAAELIERTDADHAAMDGIIARMEMALDTVRAGGSTRDLTRSAAELADLLDVHLAFEDAEIIPLFEQHFTGAEYQALDEAAMEILGVSKQALFTVPFILSEASPAEFDAAWEGAPLPFKAIYLATRGRYRRLAERALGPAPVRELAVVR